MTTPGPWIQSASSSIPPDLAFPSVVLVVDDDRAIRALCRVTLESAHVRVLTAADGHEALALAEMWIPDMLVTDIAAPGLGGFGLIRALRLRYPDLPALVMTGDEDPDGSSVKDIAAEHGAIRVLAKPFDLELLRDIVTSQCQVPGRVAPAPLASEIGPVVAPWPRSSWTRRGSTS